MTRPTLAFAVFLLPAGCAGPGDAPDHPTDPSPWEAPENQWPTAIPPEGLGEAAEGVGFEVGQVLPDLRLTDQNGDEVALWQLYGRVVLVSVSAIWCLPCRQVAEQAEGLAPEYPELVHATILEEDGSGLAPDTGDAADWASAFTPNNPVLVDPEHLFAAALDGGYPEILLVGTDLVVIADLAEFSVDDIRNLIDSEIR